MLCACFFGAQCTISRWVSGPRFTVDQCTRERGDRWGSRTSRRWNWRRNSKTRNTCHRPRGKNLRSLCNWQSDRYVLTRSLGNVDIYIFYNLFGTEIAKAKGLTWTKFLIRGFHSSSESIFKLNELIICSVCKFVYTKVHDRNIANYFLHLF